MPAAILPAAGRSRRMGRAKLLLPYGHGTLVGGLLQVLQEAGVAPIVLVVDATDSRLREWATSQPVVLSTNPAADRGMLSSIQEGLATLRSQSPKSLNEPLFVCPADHPTIQYETLMQLQRVLQNSGDPGDPIIAVPNWRGRNGHPILIGAALIPLIAELDLNVGLRQLLERRKDAVVRVPVEDPGITLDIDTPQDYRNLVQSAASAGSADSD